MNNTRKIRTALKNISPTDTIFLLLSAYLSYCALAKCQRTAQSVTAALTLSANAVIPSIMIFCATYKIMLPRLYAFFSKMQGVSKLFSLSPAGLCMVASGMLSGFPTGALIYAEMKKRGMISREEGLSLLPLSNNASAPFLIGAAGSRMFGDVRFGALLLASQTLSVLILLFLTRFERRGIAPQRITAGKITFGSAAAAIGSCGGAMITVCAFIVFFRAAADAIVFDLAPDFLKTAVYSALEISSGLSSVSELGVCADSAVLAGFAVGYSGLSVMMQVSLISGEGARRFFFRKCLLGALCAAFSFAGYALLF